MIHERYVLEASGGLTLSVLPRRGGPEALVRAAGWHNLLHRIGHHLPLVFVHDLGRLLCEPGPLRLHEQSGALEAAGIGGEHPMAPLLSPYRALMRELAGSELVQRAARMSLPDELVAALVGRVFEPVLEAMGPGAARAWLSRDLPLDAAAWPEQDPAALLAEHGGAYELVVLRWIAERAPRIAVGAERIDLDTLRLMNLFAGDASIAGAAGALELYRVLDDPSAADVIHFSLELLPQLFETRRSRGMQRFSVDGIAGVSTRGNPDQLLPSELAWPDDLFAHKYAENQLLYHGREAERESERRVHLVLVDASASMRGARAIFARGLALGLIKKLLARGEEAQLRFFDSRLHEPVRVTERDFRLPYLLSFRSERGRNYARVFKSLLGELGRLRQTAGRQAAVYFVTHGQCHVPLPIVEALVAAAWVYGIYVLPEGGLELDYVPLLARHRVVGREDLSGGERRRSAALAILDEVATWP